ncbi:MAG: metallophosphoesterase [Bacteroidales bacterium]
MKIKVTLIFLLFIMGGRLFPQAPPVVPAQWTNLKGLWNFDNAFNLLQSSFGSNLLLTGSHTSIPGPASDDLAVTIGVGSYYTCFHNISANGGGLKVNEYSMVIDFRVPLISPWYCFYQTDASNNNDGELFISPAGKIGRATNGPGYTDYQVIAGEWYRLVITADLGNKYRIYLDGVLVKEAGALAVDGDFALYPSSAANSFYFFADNDGEDAPIDIAMCAIFEGVLNPAQVQILDGYGHDIPPVLGDMLPYLQTPLPESMYISWHCDTLTSTRVYYSEDSTFNNITYGTSENIGGKTWHTVKLVNLTPNTVYNYYCASGSKNSEVYRFKTPALPGTTGQHVRFLVFGDNQTNAAKSRLIVKKAKEKVQDLYGQDIYNHINLIINHGDIVGYGLDIQSYENEYFKPFSPLSAYVPSMVSIGNHEMESDYFYQYMKYEDLSGTLSIYNEKYYAFNILNSHFIALNTNPAYQNTTQEAFLNDQLQFAQEDTNTGFIFIYGHHPPLSEIWPYGNTPWVQDHVVGNMQNFTKSAIYFSGHTHAYEDGIWESSLDSGDFRVQINGGAGGDLDRWGMYSDQTDYLQTKKAVDHYHFTLIDVDVDDRSYSGYTYSLGNEDILLDCWLIDSFHRKLDRNKPEKPIGLSPSGNIYLPDSILINPVILTSSEYSGPDSIMTVHYQLTGTPGDYLNLLDESRLDSDNWYGDTGPPLYNPVNLNEGVNLYNVTVNSQLIMDHTYGWRVRYRDHNLRWSDWSEEKTFRYVSGFSVTGSLRYDNTVITVLDSVNVFLYRNNTLVDQEIADISGNFGFYDLEPGNYSIHCTTSREWSGVNATDALLILRHFVGMTPLKALRKTAGDTDGNTFINAVDALAVSRRFAGIINSFPAADWYFEHPGFVISNENINLIIKGICVGDVNGSYLPFSPVSP